MFPHSFPPDILCSAISHAYLQLVLTKAINLFIFMDLKRSFHNYLQEVATQSLGSDCQSSLQTPVQPLTPFLRTTRTPEAPPYQAWQQYSITTVQASEYNQTCFSDHLPLPHHSTVQKSLPSSRLKLAALFWIPSQDLISEYSLAQSRFAPQES